MTKPASAIFIMGPTAAGKSALALALAGVYPCEIVSVDAAQVYRGMNIGTAKPSDAERTRVPHHLIDIRDPADPYSAAQFRDDALEVLAGITGRGRLPLLVGGTMLYFRALERGLSVLPAADKALRARLAERAAEAGWAALHAQLMTIDPVSGARIEPQDSQRIQRALEIWELTGERPSVLRQQRRGPAFPYRAVKFALAPAARAQLHARIAQRFHAMLDRGLIEEARDLLLRRDLTPALPAMRSVGYRQVIQYLRGEVGYTEMVERGIAATRQLAKRQLTWLRGETALPWFDSMDAALLPRIREFFAQQGL